MAPSRRVLAIFSVVCFLLLHDVAPAFIDTQDADEEDLSENDEFTDRKKRYTDEQNRALSYCSGKCMYEDRMSYGDCYDKCNWSGRGGSPWAHLKRPSSTDENKIYQLAKVLRTGSQKEGVVKRALDFINRDKRYTEDQNRAISYCAGLCMYNEKRTYGDCYDVCNWSGRGGSPWAQFNRPQKEETAVRASLMRTGTKIKGDKTPKLGRRSWSQY